MSEHNQGMGHCPVCGKATCHFEPDECPDAPPQKTNTHYSCVGCKWHPFNPINPPVECVGCVKDNMEYQNWTPKSPPPCPVCGDDKCMSDTPKPQPPGDKVHGIDCLFDEFKDCATCEANPKAQSPVKPQPVKPHCEICRKPFWGLDKVYPIPGDERFCETCAVKACELMAYPEHPPAQDVLDVLEDTKFIAEFCYKNGVSPFIIEAFHSAVKERIKQKGTPC